MGEPRPRSGSGLQILQSWWKSGPRCSYPTPPPVTLGSRARPLLQPHPRCESEVAQLCSTLCDPVDCSLHQAPLFMGFFRQEYWSGLRFPSPGDLPNPGMEPSSPALQADSLPSEPQGKPNLKLSLLKMQLPWNPIPRSFRTGGSPTLSTSKYKFSCPLASKSPIEPSILSPRSPNPPTPPPVS